MEQSHNEWISLLDAYRRVKEVNSHKERQTMSELRITLTAERIQCFSKDFIIQESQFCWVFPKTKVPFRHRDKHFNMKEFPYGHDATMRIEKEAYNIAYEENNFLDGSLFKYIGESEIFVYTGIHVKNQSDGIYSKLPMRDIADLSILDDKCSLEFIRFYNEDRIGSFSLYSRNEVYSLISAREVYCSRMDVETQFPYVTGRPKRTPRGRPSYTERGFHHLNENYRSASSLPSNTTMKDYLLDRFAADDPCGKVPSPSTAYQIVSVWRKSRTPDSGN